LFEFLFLIFFFVFLFRSWLVRKYLTLRFNQNSMQTNNQTTTKQNECNKQTNRFFFWFCLFIVPTVRWPESLTYAWLYELLGLDVVGEQPPRWLMIADGFVLFCFFFCCCSICLLVCSLCVYFISFMLGGFFDNLGILPLLHRRYNK
jgi:hypothetical protein